MPSRVLGASAPPPRSRRKGPNGHAHPSALSTVHLPSDDDDDDMIFTPVANGRVLSGNSIAFSDFAAQSPEAPESPEAESPMAVQSPDAEDDLESLVSSDGESADEEDEDDFPVVHVEVRLQDDSPIRAGLIVPSIVSMIKNELVWVIPGQEFSRSIWELNPQFRDNVERVYIAEVESDEQGVKAAEAHYEVYVYKTSDEGSEIQGGMEEDNDEDRTPAASVCTLPSSEIEGLWENLIYDADIKKRLLGYMNTSMLFAEHDIDRNVVSSNRLALLYGPAGTGKTSLCRALAHKLAIRYSNGRYRNGAKLIEINSHSLFSKWFSESGKLVQKLFDQVHYYLSDPGCLVVVMIDEVESIAASRAGAMSGTEPGDAVRVVNAILTQLDRLKAFPNVMVLATSNLAGGIDAAFIDRADIKQYIDLPPPEAIYWILSTTMAELGKGRGDERLAPHGNRLLSWKEVGARRAQQEHASKKEERVWLASLELRKIATRCHELQLSGRFLRRLPMLAHMRLSKRTARLTEWMTAMAAAVEDEARTKGHIAQAEGKRRRVE